MRREIREIKKDISFHKKTIISSHKDMIYCLKNKEMEEAYEFAEQASCAYAAIASLIKEIENAQITH